MKKIINEPDVFVDEIIEGLLIAHPAWIKSATADKRALVRKDAPKEGRVGIVTGGGSGHLPAFSATWGRVCAAASQWATFFHRRRLSRYWKRRRL